MNALLGRLLILGALGLASSAAIVSFTAGRRRSLLALRWAKGLAYGFCALMILATVVMEIALVSHDFSVSYVARVGSTTTPIHITIVSLWSSLEGSILFWGLVLAIYCAVFMWTIKSADAALLSYAIGANMAVATFFTFLIAGPANPFLDTPAPVPFEGPGPNPLLQNHALMIVHPPMLYLGYVGMTIPFAMGVAALLRGQLGTAWMAAIRRWMLIPWGFLTAGIVLGGWWAYEVLGWGGYWAWDPVENASLLPWLTATAFLHAAMLQERRGMLKGWTLVLLLVTFALTILGTFMTRSGIFNSVHSFTQSDIGPTLLVFLGIVLLGSVILLALRAHLLEPGRSLRSPLSRELAFIFNNLLFIALTFTVLVGTTFPLFAEAIRGVKVSVGEPFFNQFALPFGVAIVFLMGVGPALPWGSATLGEAARLLRIPIVSGLTLVALGAALGVHRLWPSLTLGVVGFAVAVTLRDMIVPVLARMKNSDTHLIGAIVEAYRRGRRRYGGQIVHLGVALAVTAIALSGAYQQAREDVLQAGETATIGDYALTFIGARVAQEPHRERTIARLRVNREGRDLGVMEPAMNHYRTQMNPIGTPAVRTGLTEDLYVSVMQVDPKGAFVGLRIYVNPAVGWLWIALGIMLLGCIVAVWPAREARATHVVRSTASRPADEAA